MAVRVRLPEREIKRLEAGRVSWENKRPTAAARRRWGQPMNGASTMNHRIHLAAIAAAALAVVPNGAAHADRVQINEGDDTSSCVTYAEFTAINDAYTHGDVTRGQVRRIFDTDGHRTSTDLMDAMAASVHTMPGTEVAVPVHRMVRAYPVCVTPDESGWAYVEFNMRSDRMVAGLWT